MYSLSAVISAHEQDVKAVLFLSPSTIYSASRDQSVVQWFRASTLTPFVKSNTYSGHSRFVNSLAYLPISSEHPNGLIVSGSNDTTICVWDPDVPKDPLYVLVGHQENVCALTVTQSGDIVSGSWDKTAKIWVSFECKVTLQGHEQAVWSVCSLSDGTIVTASADKSIKIWTPQGKLLKTFSGHTDVVRCVKPLPTTTAPLKFVSCSNDATIKIWSVLGNCVATLDGHTSFVYSLSIIPSTSEIVSCGEDRSVRVWSLQGECKQTIMLPCTSVWDVEVCSGNNDFATAGSDGCVRVFTQSSERVAAADVIRNFEQTVASHAIPSQQVGSVDKSKLPTYDDLLVNPGTKDGQVKMAQSVSGTSVEAYSWSNASSEWVKIGEVVDAVGSDRRQLYQGKEYDYVFDVDMGDGVNLKLPYNSNADPYQAAQDFIWAHELSQDFLEQIANFITTNAKGVSLDGVNAESSQYVDPYTGGSRYIPTGGNANARAGDGMDPALFGGGVAGGLTGQSSGGKDVQGKYVPKTGFVTFKQLSTSALLLKLLQFNTALKLSMTAACLTAPEESLIEQITHQVSEGDLRYFSSASWAVLYKICEWPVEFKFPGLDLLRTVLIFVPSALVPSSIIDLFLSVIRDANSALASNIDGTIPKDHATCLMLALRGVSNYYIGGEKYLWSARDEILGGLKPFVGLESNKNLRLAIVTVLLNYAIHARQSFTIETDSIKREILEMTTTFLRIESDSENLFRGLVVIGTLVFENPVLKKVCKDMQVQTLLRSLSMVIGPTEVKVKECLDEVTRVVET